eukprot:15412272-Heterocapsa_arctica.AAC.1
MYGRRDAGMYWELAITKLMKRVGSQQGASSPCVACLLPCPAKFNEWNVVVRGILGPPSEPNCERSIVILGRLITWKASGIPWGADPRHAASL